jgi:hypothetical protein
MPVKNLIITTIYRSPASNLKYFLTKLDEILNLVHNNKSEVILCEDININYLENCTKKNLIIY